MIQIGCIADDFTGASDWASFFAEKGVKTVLYNGVPKTRECTADVAVIALKTRTADLEEALYDTGKGLEWLKVQGTEKYYVKYCSTFDCTKTGNIGPIVDFVMDELGEKATILCPALPVNGRTTKEGKLYVNGQELHKSSMKDHPLTPMWDCRIAELMKEQSRGTVLSLSSELYGDSGQAAAWIEMQENRNERVYFVPDFYDASHGARIMELFGHYRLLTGGSGLCTYLADHIKREEISACTGTSGKAFIIAGSCSAATLKQIQVYLDSGKKAVQINPMRLLDGTENVDTLWQQVKDCQDDAIMLYSSQEASCVLENQKMGREKVSQLIESVQAELAQRFVEAGRKRVIVAGGETSGAITRRLGYDAYSIGKSIAPGVPMMIPAADKDVRLVLKSGNFGQEDFFLRALKMTEEGVCYE